MVTSHPRVMAATDDRSIMRGLFHGVILSTAVWVAAFYLTFILR